MSLYYQTDRFSLYEGDCRIVLRGLADCSAHSVVCDPPYELGFMGKGWDRSGIAYDASVWSECLRILKPGGHLLAFGGSRTYHRLACAVEDAGFEIRDQIQYIYGSGFPKSLNVSKNLREEESLCICDEHNSDLRGLQNRIPDMESVAEASQDADLFLSVQRQVTRAGVGHSRPQGESGVDYRGRSVAYAQDDGAEQPGVEGRCNVLSQTRQLQADQVRAMPARVSGDGPQGWLRDGASGDHGPMDRASANQNGSSTSRRSQPAEQSPHEPLAMAGQSEPQVSGAWPLCGRCGKPMVPDGLGSALKPAHEPIVLARKPFNSTLIQNVLQHGTGGLNIDGSRVEADEVVGWHGNPSRGFSGGLDSREPGGRPVSGRWPANVIHDGSDEAMAGFPDVNSGGLNGGQSGACYAQGSPFGDGWNVGLTHGDSGSAARFFYCAKANQEDRNEGLEDLPRQSAGAVTDRKDGSAGLNSPRAGAGRNNGSRNPHPTVKPKDLMRYLCRLVTPPSGTVLDPFCGSGSTGKAAMLEGLKFIGIELSAEYCELAKRRIDAVTKQAQLFL